MKLLFESLIHFIVHKFKEIKLINYYFKLHTKDIFRQYAYSSKVKYLNDN